MCNLFPLLHNHGCLLSDGFLYVSLDALPVRNLRASLDSVQPSGQPAGPHGAPDSSAPGAGTASARVSGISDDENDKGLGGGEGAKQKGGGSKKGKGKPKGDKAAQMRAAQQESGIPLLSGHEHYDSFRPLLVSSYDAALKTAGTYIMHYFPPGAGLTTGELPLPA